MGHAFPAAVLPHVLSLRRSVYRLLASARLADDIVHDTLLEVWPTLHRVRDEDAMRTHLGRHAAELSLAALAHRRSRFLRIDGVAPGDPREGLGPRALPGTWVEPIAEGLVVCEGCGLDSVELAAIAVAQQVPVIARAALVCRWGFGLDPDVTAELLGAEPGEVPSLVAQAAVDIAASVPAVSQQQTLAALGRAEVRGLSKLYCGAWEDGEGDTIEALLDPAAELLVPSHAAWFQGRADVLAFLERGPLAGAAPRRLLPTAANGQLAFASYREVEAGIQVAEGVHVLTLAPSGAITELVCFVDPKLADRFNLPEQLDDRPAERHDEPEGWSSHA